MFLMGNKNQVQAIAAAVNANRPPDPTCACPKPAANALTTYPSPGYAALVPQVINPNPIAFANAGALAANSNCLTTGVSLPRCRPGTFVAYMQQAPLYVVNTPTRLDFDVPCIAMAHFFSEIADRCDSETSIAANVTIGNPLTCCETQQITTSTLGQRATAVIAALPGCDLFIPGVLITIGFSNDVPLGPVTIGITGTDQDGCPFSIQNIRVRLSTNNMSGQLAVLFNCDVEQRLFPLLARLRTDVINLPTGTVLPGITPPNTLTGPVFHPNEQLTLTFDGPAGVAVGVETLTYNHPALSCMLVAAMAGAE
jgi:hypothetical protein